MIARDPARVITIAAHGVGLALALATVWLFRDCVVDDAYISLRYARNLLHGHGLVYNVGERVEGITNLGFTLAVAGLGTLGVDLVVAARLLGVLGAAVAVWWVPRVVLGEPDGRPLRAIARLLCLSSFSFVYFAWTGLETCAFAGVVALVVHDAHRRELRLGARFGLLGTLACATRPEGALVAFTCVALAADRHGLRAALRRAGPWTLAAGVGAIELFRFATFGAWLPNTSAVKGVFAPGAMPWYAAFGDDLAELFAATGGTAGLLLVLVAVARAHDRLAVRLALAVCGVALAFEVYAGGDWMLGYRYLQPALPWYFALVVAGGAAVVRALQWDRRLAALATGVALVAALHGWSFGLRFRQDARAYPQFVMTARDMTVAARWIGERYPQGHTIACWRIGALGWFSGLRVLDTNGLVDREVAARLGDPPALEDYLAARAPELALVRGRPGEPAPHERAMWRGRYVHVRDFDQGEHQSWQLYERIAGP